MCTGLAWVLQWTRQGQGKVPVVSAPFMFNPCCPTLLDDSSSALLLSCVQAWENVKSKVPGKLPRCCCQLAVLLLVSTTACS